MYENGGNTTHRLLDGHPDMLVYPFESQLGTRYVQDHLTSMFPVKYRWPVFNLAGSPEEDFTAIIDEECRVRLRTPHVSKFRHVALDLSDEKRRDAYIAYIESTSRSRPDNVAAFFRATFDEWKDFAGNRHADIYVGYSPAIVVDGRTVLSEIPAAHILHVVRNPWSAYGDTKKRPLPLSLSAYMLAWVVNQHSALSLQQQFPDRTHVVRFEDLANSPKEILGRICTSMGVGAADTLTSPTWNGQPLGEVYPWGTIRRPTTEANLASARSLSSAEQTQIANAAGVYLKHFGYEDVL